MTRIGLSPELLFAEEFKELRRDIEQIKNGQRIGHDIVKPKIIECLDINGDPTVYDAVAVGGDFEEFVAKFTADHQQEPWATPIYRFYIGTPGTDPAPNDVTGFSYLEFEDTGAKTIAYSGYFIVNDFMDTRNVYLKVFFYATDTGILEVTT